MGYKPFIPGENLQLTHRLFISYDIMRLPVLSEQSRRQCKVKDLIKAGSQACSVNAWILPSVYQWTTIINSFKEWVRLGGKKIKQMNKKIVSLQIGVRCMKKLVLLFPISFSVRGNDQLKCFLQTQWLHLRNHFHCIYRTLLKHLPLPWNSIFHLYCNVMEVCTFRPARIAQHGSGI